jgi:uncharacterized membrane protein
MPKIQESSGKKEYFVTSLKRLLLLSIFTAGFYQIYWFYKNWSAVKKATGANISPFWRAIFSVFWAHSLFKQITKATAKRGSKRRYPVIILTIIYILATIGSNSIGYAVDYSTYVIFGVALVLLIVSTLPLLAMQKIINARNGKRSATAHTGYGNTKGEIAMIVIGHILFLAWIASTFLFPAAPALTPEQQSLRDRAEELHAQYDDCSTALQLKEGSLNLDDHATVDAHNAELDKCDASVGL